MRSRVHKHVDTSDNRDQMNRSKERGCDHAMRAVLGYIVVSSRVTACGRACACQWGCLESFHGAVPSKLGSAPHMCWRHAAARRQRCRSFVAGRRGHGAARCRFFRLRFERLEHFEHLVTIDMYAHFVALADSPNLNPHQRAACERHASGVRSSGGARSAFRSIDELSDQADSLRMDRGGGFPPGAATASRQGPRAAWDEGDPAYDDGGGSGGYMEDMLQQHRGVYARLGTFSRLRGARGFNTFKPGERGPHGSEGGAEKPGKPRMRPMELQVRPTIHIPLSRVVSRRSCAH